MKRMGEVFELPVDGVSQIILNTHAIATGSGYQEATEHAAHAINNVDALADALGFLLTLPRGASGRIIIEKSEETLALAALKAYRGAK